MYVVQKKVHIAGIWRSLPLNTESLYYVGFFFQQRQKGKMLEVPLHTMKLYLCAKTSN